MIAQAGTLSETVDVLFVGGMGRSGSTALEMRLQAVPGVAGVGELEFLWERGAIRNELCGCGSRFADCDYWSAVLGAAGVDPASARRYAGLHRTIRTVPTLLRRRVLSGRDADLAELVAAVDRVLVEAARVGGVRVIVDSSKSPAHLMLLDRCPSVRVHVVHLVRDPRAVARSWRRLRERPEASTEEQYMLQISPLKVAANWVARNLTVEILGRRHRRYVQLRYEDFVGEPEEWIARLLEPVLGFGPERSTDGERPWHSVSGNPMRFTRSSNIIHKDDASPIGGMPRLAERAVWLVCAPLALRYGYRQRV